MDGHWKFQGVSQLRGSQGPKFLKESMKLNWNFQRGQGGFKEKNHPWGSMDIFWNHTLHINASMEE